MQKSERSNQECILGPEGQFSKTAHLVIFAQDFAKVIRRFVAPFQVALAAASASDGDKGGAAHFRYSIAIIVQRFK